MLLATDVSTTSAEAIFRDSKQFLKRKTFDSEDGFSTGSQNVSANNGPSQNFNHQMIIFNQGMLLLGSSYFLDIFLIYAFYFAMELMNFTYKENLF